MNIQPINTQTPNCGIKHIVKRYPHNDRWLVDTVFLDNGKILDIHKLYKDGELYQKLYYLTEKSGKWVKSKLKMFKGNKLIKTLRSEATKND